MFIPNAQTTLAGGDVATVIGEAGTFDKVSTLLTGGPSSACAW